MYVLLNPENHQMRHIWTTLVLLVLFPVLPAMSGFSAGNLPTRADLSGSVADPQGAAVVDASVNPQSNPVLRQNLIRVENGLIPRWNDLNMTRELNQKASPIG